MANDLLDLKNRVEWLEKKVSHLLSHANHDQGHDEFSAGWSRFMKSMGLSEQPVDPLELQREMLARGFDPEGTEFSRALVEMREE